MTYEQGMNLAVGDRVIFTNDGAIGTVAFVDEKRNCFNVDWDDKKFGGWFYRTENELAQLKSMKEEDSR